MGKKVYIFNCNGDFDVSHILELYPTIKKITGIECNKYSLIFYDENGKVRSRTGSVKSMDANIRRYISDSCSKIKFKGFEMNDKPPDALYFDTIKRTQELAIQEWIEHIFNIYIVLPYSLNEDQVINLWNKIFSKHNTNYMIHYDFDIKKDPEICMYGRPFLRGLAGVKDYYTESEYKIVYKLHDLQLCYKQELDDIFPLCITTKNISIIEQSYKSKINIGPDTYLFSK